MHILEWMDRLGRSQRSQFANLFAALARKDELEAEQYSVHHYFLE